MNPPNPRPGADAGSEGSDARAGAAPAVETLFRATRDAGRILGAACGAAVLGAYIAGVDLTVPALAGAAFSVNEALFCWANRAHQRRLSGSPKRFGVGAGGLIHDTYVDIPPVVVGRLSDRALAGPGAPR